MSFILSINAGINSSIGLFREGVPVICLEEERFNRVKNWFGFPEKALEYLLSNKHFHPTELTDIVICDKTVNNITRERFYARYDHHYNYGKLLAYNTKLSRTKFDLKNRLKSTGLFRGYVEARKEKTQDKAFNNKLHERLAAYGLDVNKITHIDHHLCHAASAYYGLAPSLDEDYLVFTLDGGGDNLRSTVSIGTKGEINRKSAINEYSIGNIYSAITHHLGFRSHEHEYKLMGLAPYVQPGYAEKCRHFFERFLFLVNEDTEFSNPEFINHSIFFSHVIRELGGSRFDNIAAGLQAFTEDIVVRWVKGNIRKYKVNKILCAGGVFMNVKLNKLLSQIPEVTYMDVFPSCGDESNIFGAAFYLHNLKYSKAISLLNSYTLGTYPGKDTPAICEEFTANITFEKQDNIDEAVAALLADNNIVARCSGRMEFGARALGNRSVLANPSHMQNINRINRSVKKRDFWMPFAPAILQEDAAGLVVIPSSLSQQGAPYMMFAFDTVEEHRENITCGIHQADFTARVQTVSKEKYPGLHAVISAFKKHTGIPCVLNTSFNLHGHPVVENARQAIEVYLKSNIDILVIEDYIIKRKK